MNLPNGAFSEYDMETIESYLKAMGKKDNYLEVGVKEGRSLAFARHHSKGNIYGIDINHEINSEYFKDKKINFIHKASNEAVKDWGKQIKVLFIDGDHTYEGVKDDWNNFSKWVQDDGVVFFHDCDETSPGVVDLANEIANKNGWGKLILYKKDGKNTSMASVERIR